MNKREALRKAWYNYQTADGGGDEVVGPINYYFEDGFDAAIDLVRSLVADLQTVTPERMLTWHNAAVENLRELVE